MTDRNDANLSALEAEVEAARARLADSLQNLTRPSISEAVRHDIRTYADTVKDEVVEKISTTREQLVSSAREAAQRRAHKLSDALRERAAANPLALILIGAGLGWRLYHRPPVATLLMGAGAASLLMNSSRRTARHFDEFHNPYRSDHPATRSFTARIRRGSSVTAMSGRDGVPRSESAAFARRSSSRSV